MGSGVGIILEGPRGVVAEQSLHFGNNQVEYEAFLVGIQLVKKLGARMLTVKSDSQLVTRQVNGEYQAKDLQLTRYLGLPSWRDPIISCLSQDVILEDPQEVQRIKREATKYVLVAGQLYRRVEAECAIKEVHEGACGSH
ncbi:hypothetical protein CR513_51347, partial [Mucuna pruriens]